MNVFVTGGSRGIGRAIVLKMIEEGYGCAFTYRENKKSAEETIALAKKIAPDSQIKAYKLNQCNPQEVETVTEEALEDFNEISVLVNNAATNKNNAAALMTNEEWEEVIQTNLSGPFYLIRQFLMPMLASRFGRIINISSLAQDGSSGQASYAASKGGLVALTKTVAREYGSKNITSNVVVVGFVETDMTQDQLAEKLRQIWMEYCPMGRVGEADEIADAVHHLTTPKAGFINGEVIRISGGLDYIP